MNTLKEDLLSLTKLEKLRVLKISLNPEDMPSFPDYVKIINK